MILLSSNVYVDIIVPLAVVAPLVLCIKNFGRLPAELRVFTYYVILSASGNLFADIFAFMHFNNLPLLHAYTVLEFVILSLFYKKVFNSSVASGTINTTIVSFVIFAIVNAIFFQSIYDFNTYPRSIGSIIIIAYTLYCFKFLLDSRASGTTRSSLVYINAALLLYFGSSFFLFLAANRVDRNMFLYSAFWTIHATFVLIMYILFTIGLLHAKRNR